MGPHFAAMLSQVPMSFLSHGSVWLSQQKRADFSLSLAPPLILEQNPLENTENGGREKFNSSETFSAPISSSGKENAVAGAIRHLNKTVRSSVRFFKNFFSNFH